jgi:hypothetical protein
MNNRQTAAAINALEWQLICALVGGWVMVAVRVVGVALLLAGADKTETGLGALLAESVACGALMTRFQKRQIFAPVLLLGIWAMGFWSGWQGEDAPPVLFTLGSLAIGIALSWGIYVLIRLHTLGRADIEPPAT